MLTHLLYRVKRLLHRHPALYEFLFNLATLNADVIKLRFSNSSYVSKFGGMWTDHQDYRNIMRRKLASGQMSSHSAELVEQWHTQGFVVLPQAINANLIDDYQHEIAQLKALQPSPLMVTAVSLPDPTPYSAKVEEREQSVRTVDDYYFSEASRKLLMHPPIMRFLRCVFEAQPLLNQSLSFQHGSQQAVHQDTAFVRMNSPMKLAAIWIALEDIKPGSGELNYYPGSHRWEGYLFSGRFKHWDEERDGLAQLQEWHNWIHAEAKRRRCTLQTFAPRKGDVFIWHAALAHGGAPVKNPDLTRRSLVGHYCPENVRPLYHYYKPLQRKKYTFNEFKYCTSYYRNN